MRLTELAQIVGVTYSSLMKSAEYGFLDLEKIDKKLKVVENDKLKNFISSFSEVEESESNISVKKLAKIHNMTVTNVYQSFNTFKKMYRGRYLTFVYKDEKYLDYVRYREGCVEPSKEYLSISMVSYLSNIKNSGVGKAIKRGDLDSVDVFDYNRRTKRVINNEKLQLFIAKKQNNSKSSKRGKNFSWLEDHLKNDKISYDRPAQITRISGLDEIESLDYSYAI